MAKRVFYLSQGTVNRDLLCSLLFCLIVLTRWKRVIKCPKKSRKLIWGTSQSLSFLSNCLHEYTDKCFVNCLLQSPFLKIIYTPADWSVKLMSINYKRNAQILRGLKIYKVVQGYRGKTPRGWVFFFELASKNWSFTKKKTHPENFILPGRFAKFEKTPGGVGFFFGLASSEK